MDESAFYWTHPADSSNTKKGVKRTHITEIHKEETDVLELVATKDPVVRRNLLAKIRNMGNHRHNMDVKRRNKGVLLVKYRPDGPVKPECYGPCSFCYGWYVMTSLFRHKCPCKTDKCTVPRPMLKAKLMMPSVASQQVAEILGKMTNDSVSRTVKGDRLNPELARREQACITEPEQETYIRNKARELGRLLLQLR